MLDWKRNCKDTKGTYCGSTLMRTNEVLAGERTQDMLESVLVFFESDLEDFFICDFV